MRHAYDASGAIVQVFPGGAAEEARLAALGLALADAPADWPVDADPRDYRYIGGVCTQTPRPETLLVPPVWDGAAWQVDLAGCQAAACAEVDRQAETVRLLVLTPGAGQSMAYQQKEAEAAALQNDPDPDPADYVFLSAEVGITPNPATGLPAADIAEVAAIVLALAAAWKPFGGAVETVRLAAKRDINAAESEAAIAAVLAGLSWPAAPAE